MVEKARR